MRWGERAATSIDFLVEKDDPLAFVESLAPDIKERVFSLVQERDAAIQRDARLRGQISAIDRKNHQERIS